MLGAFALALSVPVVQAQVLPSFGEERSGSAAFQFLKIPVDPRGAALGETAVSNASDASALFWNPALASRGGRTEVGVSSAAYYADVALHYAAGYSRVGPVTVGLSLQALDSGEMAVTTEFSGPEGTGQTFRLVDIAAGLTVSQALTDLFSYGVTAKYVRESVAGVSTQAVLADLGVFYKIGDTGVQLGVAIRNFGFENTPGGEIDRTAFEGTITETEFEGAEPPTTFLLGASYRPFARTAQHDLVVSGQLTNPSDNSERYNVGVEYIWNELLSLRAGYRFGADEATLPSVGAGLQIPGIGPNVRVDYGFNSMERLGAVHRVGVNVRLN